jgi:RNA polymerase sigma-70 factor (ECF subfamily)
MLWGDLKNLQGFSAMDRLYRLKTRMGTDEGDETQLIERAANGDGDAFTELFNRYYSMIYAFAYRLSLQQADAQEIAQDTFIKAARSLGAFRSASSFKNWLYRIARNSATDWLRHKVRQTKLVESLAEQEREQPTDFSHLHDALRALPDDLRAAIVLTIYEGMNHAEVADILGCAETTVSWRVFMAKRKLKEILSRLGYG